MLACATGPTACPLPAQRQGWSAVTDPGPCGLAAAQGGLAASRGDRGCSAETARGVKGGARTAWLPSRFAARATNQEEKHMRGQRSVPVALGWREQPGGGFPGATGMGMGMRWRVLCRGLLSVEGGGAPQGLREECRPLPAHSRQGHAPGLPCLWGWGAKQPQRSSKAGYGVVGAPGNPARRPGAMAHHAVKFPRPLGSSRCARAMGGSGWIGKGKGLRGPGVAGNSRAVPYSMHGVEH